MIAILDLGIGNLSSVRSGFQRAGSDTVVIAAADEWETVKTQYPALSGVVLPGVGAFGDAMDQLRTRGLLQVVKDVVREGRPLLGICLGMQLLFSRSEEHGSHLGLDVIPGTVVRFEGDIKIPHMGWNTLTRTGHHPLLHNVDTGDYVYFVHSFYALMQSEEHLLAFGDYGPAVVPAVVAKQSVYGTQFHPEKSGEVGEQILRNFVQICRTWKETEVIQSEQSPSGV